MKLLNIAEANLDPVLVSAAGICPHMKDENMGTISLCHKLSLPLQPVPRHKIAKNLPCFQQAWDNSLLRSRSQRQVNTGDLVSGMQIHYAFFKVVEL